jgi:hypothetical protein
MMKLWRVIVLFGVIFGIRIFLVAEINEKIWIDQRTRMMKMTFDGAGLSSSVRGSRGW